LPATSVAAAGGWKDTKTMQSSYQIADEAKLLAVISCTVAA